MSTNPIGSATATNPPASGASGSSGSSATGGVGGLTMNDFLTLMTAQLQNQDPLNPTDSNQFLSQLSELSTVEGISQLNTSMTTLSNSMLSSQALTSASLVGQGILAPASSAAYYQRHAAQRRGAGAYRRHRGGAHDHQCRRCHGQSDARAGDRAACRLSAGTARPATAQPAPSGTYNVSATAMVGGADPGGHDTAQRHGLERDARRRRRQPDTQYPAARRRWRSAAVQQID